MQWLRSCARISSFFGLLALFQLLVCGWLEGAEPSVPIDSKDSESVQRGLLPKYEIGALRYLEEHPEYDGRGVKVAVFDTGVDPGAAGLQRTSDGRPKIVDLVDASGSGDVDTSAVREALDGRVTGLSGRELRLPTEWLPASSSIHLGLKPGYELYPDELVVRVKEERRVRWLEAQRRLETQLRRDLARWDEMHEELDGALKLERADLETRLETLHTLQERYEDPGPIYDCVVFHDGEVWRAAIDTDSDGDFADEMALTDYHRERSYATLGDETLLNFAVNIYEEGDLLSIVTDSGMHGTHVAGIVAAYYPEQPELNGIAPGAQIVSVKIGDTRLEGMETSTGFERGLGVVRQHGCDVINLSYGEPTTLPNAGRLTDLLAEIVQEDGVVFVSSAGNAGPALSTVGAPGGTTSALLGVGAYVSPAMMEAGYSMREGLPETHYTWTSRGPTRDGDLGVNISAPGGAVSPVPNWTLRRSQLANGTSMASPNAAGAIALILSGLKAESSAYTPEAVRLALENTARLVEGVEVHTQGRGLIDVNRAYAWCQAYGEVWARMPRLEVTVPRRDQARGIYLREPQEAVRHYVASVLVKPVYREGASSEEKVAFERRYRLQTTVPWIRSAQLLHLVHGGRAFDVSVDPTELEVGMHFGEVLGFDRSLPDAAGPAFRLPVTVSRPIGLDGEERAVWGESLAFEPGQVERRFFEVPGGASWAELKVEAGELPDAFRLAAHVMQLLPRRLFTVAETKTYLSMRSHVSRMMAFPVTAGGTLEVCLTPYWSVPDAGVFEVNLEFKGLRSEEGAVVLPGDERLVRVDVTAGVAAGRLSPRAELRTRMRGILPTKAELRPLPEARDGLPRQRQVHELVLHYDFKLEREAAVVPRFPALNGRLYDGEFGSQLWMLFDENKRRIATDDGWDPGAVSLAKGGYALRFHLRDDDAKRLRLLETLPLVLEQRLGNPLRLDAYAGPDEALVGGQRFAGVTLLPGERAVFWLAGPDKETTSGLVEPGEWLTGTMRYEEGAGAPSYALTYLPPRMGGGLSRSGDGEEDASGTVMERFEEDLRDWKVAQLERWAESGEREAFEKLFRTLRGEGKDQLSLYAARLHLLDDDQRKQRLRSVVEAADAVLAQIDTDALAAWFGKRVDTEDEEARAVGVAMKEQRVALIDALYRKGRALAWMELPYGGEGLAGDLEIEEPYDSEKVARLFEETFCELGLWVDPEDDEVVLLTIRREWRHGRLGEALKLLQGQIEKTPGDRKLLRKRLRLLKALGWDSWVRSEEQSMLIRFPEKYPIF